MLLNNKKILIISPEEYGEVFLSKHHYAHELSKNNKVWFLNAKGNRIKKGLVNQTEINPNLSIVDYYNVYYGFGKLPFFVTALINLFISKKIQKTIGQLDIVWSFEQAKFFNLKLFKADYSIFHPVDFIPFFDNYKNRIAQSADIIFSVSQEILNTFKTKGPKYFINHGVVDYPSSLPATLKHPINKTKINIGYIGNINIPYLDIQSLKTTIIENPHCDFHFLGPIKRSNISNLKSTTNYEELSLFENVYFQGIIEQEKLVATAKEFDLLISCYDYEKNPIRLSNSHKILEYMMTGKIIVSNYFPTYEKIDPEMMIIVKDNKNFAATIADVVNKMDDYNSEAKIQKRIKFAKENTYEKQLNKIERFLTDLNR